MSALPVSASRPEVSAGELAFDHFSLHRLGVFVGARVTDIDLTQPLDDHTVSQITQALAHYGLLVLPQQDSSAADLKRFGRCFGPLRVHPFSSNAEDDPELIVFDNKEGNPPAATDVWHSDETFRVAPPMATVLCSKQIPEVGGDTEFANMAAVYDSLSDRWKRFLDGLEAVHDFKPFRGLFPATPEGIARMRRYEDLYPPATHPVVSLHPVTGRKVLFVNPQFTLYIKGLPEDESRMILDMLFRKTQVHEYHYRHRWEPNMLIVWDNRLVQHSALHDYYPHRRHMERVTITGSPPIAASEPAPDSDLRRYLMPPVSAFRGSRQRRQHEIET